MTTASIPATSVSPTAGRLWRRSRWFLLATALLLLSALLISGLNDDHQYPPLDPRSPDPDGARAAVHLLEKQGLTTRTVGTEDELAAALRQPDTTVVLPLPDLLSHDQLAQLATVARPASSRLILIQPQDAALDSLAAGITTADGPAGQLDAVVSHSVPAGCPLIEAERAGSAELGGTLYRPGPGDTACYRRDGAATLIEHHSPFGTSLIVLGTGHPLTNQSLAKDGNAALALGLLGSRPHLVWYLPDFGGPGSAVLQRKSLTDYIPDGWRWAALQLAIAALLTATWRARRLGPVVSENLPVVVRAAETTLGRARLYQRGKARDRAAEALRQATRHRLAAALALPLTSGEPDPTALCAAVAARVDRPASELTALLYGDAPTTDAALLRLTDELDALERQVRQP